MNTADPYGYNFETKIMFEVLKEHYPCQKVVTFKGGPTHPIHDLYVKKDGVSVWVTVACEDTIVDRLRETYEVMLSEGEPCELYCHPDVLKAYNTGKDLPEWRAYNREAEEETRKVDKLEDAIEEEFGDIRTKLRRTLHLMEELDDSVWAYDDDPYNSRIEKARESLLSELRSLAAHIEEKHG